MYIFRFFPNSAVRLELWTAHHDRSHAQDESTVVQGKKKEKEPLLLLRGEKMKQLWICAFFQGEEKREEEGFSERERTVIHQKAVNRSRTGEPRPDHLPPRALLSPTWNSCSPGLPPHVFSPPPGNQSRSSYFRAIQPLPPVLCGPNARDVSRAESSMEFAVADALFFARLFFSIVRISFLWSDILSICKSKLCNRRDWRRKRGTSRTENRSMIVWKWIPHVFNLLIF